MDFAWVYSGQLELEALPLYVLLPIWYWIQLQLPIEYCQGGTKVGGKTCALYSGCFILRFQWERGELVVVIMKEGERDNVSAFFSQCDKEKPNPQ